MVVRKLARLVRSVPDARDIADELTRRQVKLRIGGSVHDPTDPVGELLFHAPAMVAEFEVDLQRLRTREGLKVAKAKAEGRLRGKQPKLSAPREEHLVKLYDDKEKNAVESAKLFAVGRSTVYRTLARAHALAVVDAGKGDRDTCARWGLPGEGMMREAVENMGALSPTPGPFIGSDLRKCCVRGGTRASPPQGVTSRHRWHLE